MREPLYVITLCVAVCVSLNVSVCLSHYCWVESVCDAAVDCSGSRWSILTTKSSVISSSQNQMELLPSWWVQRPNHLLLSRCFYVCLYPHHPPCVCLPVCLSVYRSVCYSFSLGAVTFSFMGLAIRPWCEIF